MSIKIRCANEKNLKLALASLEKIAKERGAKKPLKIKKGPNNTAEISGVPAPIPYAQLSKKERAKIDASPICKLSRNRSESETSAPSKRAPQESEGRPRA